MLRSFRLFNSLFLGGMATAMLFTTSCDNKKKEGTATTSTKTTEAPATTPTGKIAYINLDTLQTKYEYFKQKKSEFDKKTAAMNAEIERLAQSLENEYTAFQKKAQAGTLTQAEGEAGQKKLGQMQQNIESRRQTLGAQLMKEQETIGAEFKKRIDEYLIKYNADKKFDFILSYSEGGGILYANKALDITEDIVKGMNAEAPVSATEKK